MLTDHYISRFYGITLPWGLVRLNFMQLTQAYRDHSLNLGMDIYHHIYDVNKPPTYENFIEDYNYRHQDMLGRLLEAFKMDVFGVNTLYNLTDESYFVVSYGYLEHIDVGEEIPPNPIFPTLTVAFWESKFTYLSKRVPFITQIPKFNEIHLPPPTNNNKFRGQP